MTNQHLQRHPQRYIRFDLAAHKPRPRESMARQDAVVESLDANGGHPGQATSVEYVVAPERCEADGFVLPCYDVDDGPLLSEAVNESYEHLRGLDSIS